MGLPYPFRHPPVRGAGIAADVRRQNDIRQRAKITASLDRCVRLVLEDVERGAGQTASGQRIEQRRFVDHPSARGVDQPAPLAKAGETLAIQPVKVLAAGRHVQTDEIGVGHGRREIIRHLVEVFHGNGRRSARPRTADHAHAVAKSGNARERAADAAAADDDERLALQLLSHHRVPGPSRHAGGDSRQLPRRSAHQQHRMFGD